MAKKLYAAAALKLVTGDIDLDADTFKCLAVASNGGFDPGAAEYTTLTAFLTALGSNEFDGSGYSSASRPTIDGVSVALTGGTLPVVFDATDETITSLSAGTYPIEGWLIYVDGADNDNRWPLFWMPYTSAQTPNGNNFVIQWNSNGLFRLSQSA